jgi:hypothetical protein
MLVLGAIWWRAIGGDVSAVPEYSPTEETIRIANKPDSVEWNVFTLRLKNGDVIHVEGTHYVQAQGVLQIKDWTRNVAVYTVPADRYESIIRQKISP